MLKQLQNIVFKSVAVFLVVTVLAPAVTKIAHVFTHHEHEVCKSTDASEEHFHKLDKDCEFYKFKLTNSFFFNFENRELEIQVLNSKLKDLYRSFFYPHQQYISYLRGPPLLA